MTTYRGYGGCYQGARVTVQRDGMPEEPLRHHVRHSPSGFAWGYHGSGPAELARCILIDHLGLHERAEHDHDLQLPLSYQDFKTATVGSWPWHEGGAGLDDPAWTLTDAEIEEWIDAWHDQHEAPSEAR